MNLFHKYFPLFINEANKSDINYRLAAGVLRDKKLVTKPCCNQDRNFCRGQFCTSIHAEAKALLTYYGKNLQFDSLKKRWCLLLQKCKKAEKG